MTPPLLSLEHDFAARLPGLCEPWEAAAAPNPRLLLLNEELAEDLGLDPVALRTDAGVAQLLGHDLGDTARPVAQAYAGHQFGGLSPRLGDGRALLLGEVAHRDGGLRDLHLKGSGRTPFSRGGDGKAALGPVLREYVMGEAMHALGIPTTRALAAIATGEAVYRDRALPGAVLVRVAASHLRVGTFQYAALQRDRDLLASLLDYAIERHHPQAAEAPIPALGLLAAVVDAQAELVAGWMLIGFIHGVMNTDNTTISGETIDYGPCAFMDRYDAQTVFSSIDHGGRYAYGNQPSIAHWNLARLAEALLPLVDGDSDVAIPLATEVLDEFPARCQAAWLRGMRAKLGLLDATTDEQVADLTAELLALLAAQRVDFTSWFRALADAARGEGRDLDSLADPVATSTWLERWSALHVPDAATAMDAVNPRYIPRNHLVEAALDAAVERDDLGPTHELLGVLADPFTRRDGFEAFEGPAPEDFGPYQTFCGT